MLDRQLPKTSFSDTQRDNYKIFIFHLMMSNREAQQRGFIFRSSQPSINYRDIRAFTLQRYNVTEMQTAS